mgnify:CR=1 FL=1
MKKEEKELLKRWLLNKKEEEDLCNSVFYYYGDLGVVEIEAVVNDLGLTACCKETAAGIVVSISTRYNLGRRYLIDYIARSLLYNQFDERGCIFIEPENFNLKIEEVIKILNDLRGLNLIPEVSNNKIYLKKVIKYA